MATKTIEIRFPVGVNRRLSFRQEAGRKDRYFAPYSMNVRTEGFNKRLRGGSWSPSDPTIELSDTTLYIVDSDGNTVIGASGSPLVLDRIDPGPDAPDSSLAECIYRDRFVRANGGIIYASRQSAYQDWSLSADVSDVQRPWVMQLSEAGEIGKEVIAFIPHKDNYLLAFTSGSMWVIQGDPAHDGAMRNISREVGIVGPKAWTRDHLDRYYFLSPHGLYVVSANGDGLQAISEDVIPEELTGVENPDTVLAYDHETRGVYIHIPGEVGWLFDTERQGFWSFKIGYDGSHIAIGPLLLGNASSYGRLYQLHGITANGGTDVTWRVLVADTAEQVCINAKNAMDLLIEDEESELSNVHSTGVWSSGINHRSFPRSRGQYMILLLSALSGDWAWEGASAMISTSGAWR